MSQSQHTTAGVSIWKLVWKELFHHRGLALSFVINLSLGLVGFITLDAFKASVSDGLESRSKTILGADVALSTRRELTTTELDAARLATPPNTSVRQERSFFSMAWNGSKSRLVEIRAIDSSFPFYGNLTLEHAGEISINSKKDIIDQQRVWIYPELAIQMGLEIGDQLQLGQASFEVSDLINADPSVSNMSFSPAPKVMIGLEHLEKTGLLTFGSRQEHRVLFKLPEQQPSKDFSKILREACPGSDINIKTHHDASMQLSRLLGYLGDYLGLVSLVALFLSAVGTAYLFQSYIEARQKNLAILLALGCSFRKIIGITLLQLLSLGFMACIISILGCAWLLPFVPELFGNIMVDHVELSMGWRSSGLALLTGCGGAIFFSLPAFHRLSKLKPAELFRETTSTPPTKGKLWAWIPTLLTFWGLAIWQAQSVKVASAFIGIFLLSILFLVLAGHLIFSLANRAASHVRHWTLRLSIQQLVRQQRATLACFIAIGLGSFLLTIIPQLSDVMRRELQMEGEHQRPSLFLFDIQPEQTERLTHMMDKSSASLQHLSPLVSARLVSIKGKPVELDDDGFGREAEQRTRFRNRRLNLSARSQLSDSESMVSGRDFSGTFDPETNAPAEASLEVRYAERLGLNVDDIFTVDILGFQIKAKVVNLRKVRWTSFQPNFFVVFQPGVLDDAPKTYLSSIIDQREVDVVAKLQQQIVKTFPNIGVVDITQTLNRLLQVVNQMLFAIQVTAWVSLIAGFGVLFSIARQQLRARMKDLVLVSLLGAKSSSLRSMLLIEFSLLGFWAGGCGLVCGTMGSSAFSWFLFEGSLIPNISTSLLQWLGIILLTTITGLMSSWQSLSRPFSYAQQRKALA